MLLMFTARNYKVNAACIERCLYYIYTEIPCLEMSGSSYLAALDQVCFQTLFVVRQRFQTGYYFRKGMVDFEKVGRTVYGSGDTLV